MFSACIFTILYNTKYLVQSNYQQSNYQPYFFSLLPEEYCICYHDKSHQHNTNQYLVKNTPCKQIGYETSNI